MDTTSDVVIRGMSNPLLVLLISSIEEVLGVLVPMPIFWEKAQGTRNKEQKKGSRNTFFIAQ